MFRLFAISQVRRENARVGRGLSSQKRKPFGVSNWLQWVQLRTKHHRAVSQQLFDPRAVRREAYGSLGKFDKLLPLFAETQNRAFNDAALQSRFCQTWSAAKAAIDNTEQSYHCGTAALLEVAQAPGAAPSKSSPATRRCQDRPTILTNADGAVFNYSYDDLSRTRTRSNAATGQETFTYTARGLTSYKDQLLKETLYEYDEAGHRTKVTTPSATFLESFLRQRNEIIACTRRLRYELPHDKTGEGTANEGIGRPDQQDRMPGGRDPDSQFWPGPGVQLVEPDWDRVVRHESQD